MGFLGAIPHGSMFGELTQHPDFYRDHAMNQMLAQSAYTNQCAPQLPHGYLPPPVAPQRHEITDDQLLLLEDDNEA